MTSASVAVKRLQSESLQQKSLNELKQDATELGLSKEDVKQFGNLTHKQTWLAAVEKAVATQETAIAQSQDIVVQRNTAITTTEQNAVTKSQDIAVQRNIALCDGYVTEQIAQAEQAINNNVVQRYTDDELPIEPTHPLIDGQWTKQDNNPKPYPILPFRPVLTEPSKPDNSGYLVWNEKLQNWVKEKPDQSSTPIRDKLLAKMMGYVDKGISLSDLEEMQKESPDEQTAAIYLVVLEESERILIEAVA